jgi:hypothetical protein
VSGWMTALRPTATAPTQVRDGREGQRERARETGSAEQLQPVNGMSLSLRSSRRAGRGWAGLGPAAALVEKGRPGAPPERQRSGEP